MANPVAADFRAELERLDLLLHREILRMRAAYQLSLDEFRGLYVSDEQVDRLVTESHPRPDGDETAARMTRDAEAILSALGDASPLGRMAREFELTPFERDVVLLAVAPELDLKYETLYAYLNNSVARRNPTVDLALRVFGRERRSERALLLRSARLYRQALIEPIDAASERRSELSSAFTLSPAVAAWLQAMPPFDPRLYGWVEPAEADSDAPGGGLLAPRVAATISRLAEALRSGDIAPLVVIEGEAGQGPGVAAGRLLGALGYGMLRLLAGGLPEDQAPGAALTLVARLRHAGVFLDMAEGSPELSRRLPVLLTRLHRAGVPVVLAVVPHVHWRPLVRGLPHLRLSLDEPEAPERHTLWTEALQCAGLKIPEPLVLEVAERFRLGPAQIADAARALRATPLLDGGDDAREHLFQTARAQSAGDLGQLASPVPKRHRWEDLVLPPVILRRLKEVTGAVRSRATVFRDWGFGDRSGSGLMVLFSGSSGTGKTMSASVIAREVGLDLHRLDLASVVSKYIGETEKNLNRVFEAARSANVILFFDEADALLGKRSEVKDAHDRYANIEVAYLLQKMEDHDGVVILASNFAKNMDQAFARRMHYVVEFSRPDAALREQLWRGIFPPQAPLAGDVDFGFLGRQFELTGGDVKTIALDAAFLAAGEGRAIAMNDLVGAVSRQMLKQGKPLGASDFKQYHGRLDGEGNRPAVVRA